MEGGGEAEEQGAAIETARVNSRTKPLMRDVGFVGDGVGRNHDDDAAQAGKGHGHAGGAAAHGEQQALGEQLADEPPAPGPHGARMAISRRR